MLEKLQDDVLTIVKKIEEEREKDDPRSFVIAPFLSEIITLLNSFKEDNQEAINFLYKTYNYVAKMYTYIGRFTLASKYRLISLKYAKRLIKVPKDTTEIIYQLLRDRNYYVDDDCEDVKELAQGIIDPTVLENIFAERMKNRRSLKHDPIEMSDEYLAVIDEVEEKVYKNRTISGMGACHEIWHLKYIYLAEKGIEWRSPAMMNPHVMFD